MEPHSGTRRKIKPRCIVNYSTSRRPAIDAYHTLQLLVFSLLWPDRGDCKRRSWVIPFARNLARTGGFSPMPVGPSRLRGLR